MNAFNFNKTIKSNLQAAVRTHAAANTIRQDRSIGSLFGYSNRNQFEAIGIPAWFACAIDNTVGGLSATEYKQFAADWLRAMPVGFNKWGFVKAGLANKVAALIESRFNGSSEMVAAYTKLIHTSEITEADVDSLIKDCEARNWSRELFAMAAWGASAMGIDGLAEALAKKSDDPAAGSEILYSGFAKVLVGYLSSF